MKDTLSNGRRKTINTEFLSINGNAMLCNDLLIQISNISLISISPVALSDFPWKFLIVLALGLYLFRTLILAVLIIGAIIILVLYFWHSKNEEYKQQAILTIQLDSGYEWCIRFEDKEFLKHVFDVLKNVIEDDNNKQVYINIKNSQISDDASVLNDLHF